VDRTRTRTGAHPKVRAPILDTSSECRLGDIAGVARETDKTDAVAQHVLGLVRDA
jgi:hypothetical protein